MTTFLQVLRGEWTKFRSVRSSALCLVAAVAVTVLLELLGSTAGSTDANKEPSYTDQAYFVHTPLSGDGTVVARVVSQRDSRRGRRPACSSRPELRRDRRTPRSW